LLFWIRSRRSYPELRREIGDGSCGTAMRMRSKSLHKDTLLDAVSVWWKRKIKSRKDELR
jgi:hypothetical protein